MIRCGCFTVFWTFLALLALLAVRFVVLRASFGEWILGAVFCDNILQPQPLARNVRSRLFDERTSTQCLNHLLWKGNAYDAFRTSHVLCSSHFTASLSAKSCFSFLLQHTPFVRRSVDRRRFRNERIQCAEQCRQYAKWCGSMYVEM